MTDVNPLFRILDNGSGAGLAPHSRVEGDAAAAQRGLIGFSFKDSNGDLVLPQLTADGRISVSTQSPGSCVYARGELAAPAAANTLEVVTGAEITLTANKTYKNIGILVSSFVASHFVVEHIDDEGGVGTVTKLADFNLGPGDNSESVELSCLEFTAGATGVQKLRVRVEQLETLACARATISALELA